MAVDWTNVKILRSPLTNIIYLGKLRVKKNGVTVAYDKSTDRTDEVLVTVAAYFDEEAMRAKRNRIELKCEAGKLIWEKNEVSK